jgi:thiol-disulfide isomerase/thioredoxin
LTYFVPLFYDREPGAMMSRILLGAVLAGCLVGCMPPGKTGSEKTGGAWPSPNAAKASASLFTKAQTAWRAQDADGAIAALDELLKVDPKHRQGLYFMAVVLHSKGMASYQAGDSKAAIPVFIKAAEHGKQLLAAYPRLDANERSMLAHIFYSEACAKALDNHVDKAVAAVESAVALGYTDVEEKNTAFDGIRKDPKFQALLKELPAKIAAVSQKHAKELLAEYKPFDFDFSLPRLDGKTVTKQDFAGKVVIVDFWGTWCPPCRMEIPHFLELHQRYRAAGLEIVGINYEQVDSFSAPGVIREFVEQNKVTYPCLIGDQKTKTQVPGFGSFPTTLFLDRSGKVRLSLVGYHSLVELEAIVKLLLDEKRT